MFILQSTCDLLVGVVRNVNNLYIGITHGIFCQDVRASRLIDLCLQSLRPLSEIIAFGITVHRYLYVHNSLHRCTKFFWRIIFIVTTTAYIGTNISSVIYHIKYEILTQEQRLRHTSNTLYRAHISLHLLVLFQIVAINSLLGRYVLNNAVQKFTTRSTVCAHLTHERTITTTLVIVNVCQVVTLSPLFLLQFVNLNVREENLIVSYTQYSDVTLAKFWLYLLTYVNYGLNAIIYIARGQKYRVFIREALGGGGKRKTLSMRKRRDTEMVNMGSFI